MPYQLFYNLFPDLAERETRSLLVRDGIGDSTLPEGEYALCEMFCNERG